MDLETLLSLLGTDQANASSYHDQSPSHASPANASHNRGPSNTRAFTPNFDVLETKDAYILEGELAGLSDKRAVDIEFTDHQTLLVKGKIEKASPTTSAAPSEAKQITPVEHHEEQPRPKTPPKPTVEDDIDEDDDGKSTILTPTSTIVSHPEEKKQEQQPQPQKKKDQTRYWVSERTIGSFQRTFSFPGLIDQEKVTAKLENGILTIVVPKRQKLPTRKIEIQ